MARMLIRSYLSRRTTKTKVGHAISDYITLDRGIGKGSVIGPMFFICILIDFSVLEAKGVIDLKKVDVEGEINLVCYADHVSALVAADTEDEVGIDIMSKNFLEYFST